IGSPGYPLDEAWLRRIGELMYARGGFDRAARARQGAAILASGDRTPALATQQIPDIPLIADVGQHDRDGDWVSACPPFDDQFDVAGLGKLSCRPVLTCPEPVEEFRKIVRPITPIKPSPEPAPSSKW
ncbi:MAG TPA: hypothetical protein VFD73_05800, partial [Gemmatimonadales bacterium]|nr:hypothetical protein [Gemmatimonadales bacterium]